MSSKPKQPRCPVCGRFMADITWLTSYVVEVDHELLFGCRKCRREHSFRSARFFVRDRRNSTKWYEKDSIPVRRKFNVDKEAY